MNDGAANHSWMRHCHCVTMIALFIHPAPDTVDEVHYGLAPMWCGEWIGQPRDDALRIILLQLLKLSSSPCAIVAIAEFDRRDRRQSQGLSCLLRPALGAGQNALRPGRIPADCGDLRDLALLQRLVQRKGRMPKRLGRSVADECQSGCHFARFPPIAGHEACAQFDKRELDTDHTET